MFSFIVSLTVAFAQPTADFTANKTSGCSPLSVQFTDASTGSPTSYSWAFGNGNNSTLQNPSAVYVIPGTYTVSLTVTNASGNNTKTKVAYITVFTSPIADFSTAVTGGCMPLNVPFTNTSTPGSSAITNWLWDFGDGSIGNTQSPTHAYTIAGTKNVSLTVTDANGCLHTVVKNNVVNVTQSHTVDFTVTNPVACNPPTTHTLTAVVNPPASNYIYEWATGNGMNANTSSFNLVVNNPGTTWVWLKVKAASGCEAYATKYAAIFTPSIKADFTVPSTGVLCNDATLTFTNITTPDTTAISHQWYVNNVLTAVTKDLNHKFNVGTHTVKLVSTTNSCVDSISKTITVYPKPIASFTATPFSICKAPADVKFQSTSTGTGLTYSWDFGNGFTSTNAIDSTVYPLMQNYVAKLIVTNSVGCQDSMLSTITAQPLTAVIGGYNQKKGCSPYNANLNVVNQVSFTQFEWSYNGNVIGTSPTMNYVFADTGRHVVRLKATNSFGCESILFDTLWVGRKLAFDFITNKTNGCYSGINPIQFTAIENSGLGGVEYLWSWKNGSTSGKSVSVTLPDTGFYDVQLTVTYNGCDTAQVKPHFITVYPALAAVMPISVGCSVDSVLLDASRSYGKNKFLWSFGDGQTSTLPVLYHTYATHGNYSIVLVTMDTTTNCSDTVRSNLLIASTPNLNFVVNDSLGCTPLKVRLRNTSVLDSNAYPIAVTNWSFTSGEQAIGNDTTSLISGYGFHDLIMTITDTKGCVYALRKDSVARVSGINMKFAVTPLQGCTPLLVTGKDSSVLDFGFKSRTWYWLSPDSTHTTQQSIDTASYVITHPNFIQKDGYQITLRIQDTLGCQFVQSKTITATQPRLFSSFYRVPFCGYQQLNFTADTTAIAAYGPATYKWIYDNSPVTNFKHTRNFSQYDTTISYRLEVTDANGCMQFKDTLIHIENKRPLIGFFANQPKRDCYLPINPVTLVDTTIAGSTPMKSRVWKVGANTSSLASPSFVISLPGKYDVSLTLTDSVGCVDSLVIPEYIQLGGPIGTYQITPKIGCQPLGVKFDVQSPNALYRIWDFGNGLVDTIDASSYIYTYNDPGKSVPRLTLVDSSAFCAFAFDAVDTITIYPKPEVNFTVDKTFICFNTEVTFFNNSPSKAAIQNWKWKVNNRDSFSLAGPLNYVFNSAGSFTVSLIGVDTNGCADTLTMDSLVDVFADNIAPVIPKTIYATVVDDNHVEFKYTANNEPDFVKYIVYYNYFSGTAANTSEFFNKEDTVFVQDNINTLTSPYSYSVSAVDVCENISDSAILHTTVDVTAKPLTNSLQVKWTPYKGFAAIKSYEIWRNNPDSGNTFYRIVTVNSATTQYNDTTAKCFVNYLYKIKTIDGTDNSNFSWSDTSGASPIYLTNLSGTTNFRATVLPTNRVLLQWLKRDADLSFEYLIFRKRDDDDTYRSYASTRDTFLIDEDVDVGAHSYSYITYLKDECGGLSTASNEAKTILLQVDLTVNDLLKYDPMLYFTPYQLWQNGVSKYEVDFYADSLELYGTIASLSPFDTAYLHKYNFIEQRAYCYRVTAYENGGNLAISESNVACVETKPRMYAPSAFTINGDGLNERFLIKGVFIDEFHLSIFDRWGRLVFETTDLQKGWDGSIDGKPAPAGVYVYIAEGSGRKGQPAAINGTITLIR